MSTLPAALLLATERYSHSIAMRFKKDGTWNEVTYFDLRQRVMDLSKGLLGMGVLPGDRIALMCTSRPEWGICDAAIQSVGAVTVPIYPTSSVSSTRFLLEHSEAKLAFAESGECLTKVLEAHERVPTLQKVISIDEGAFPLEKCVELGKMHTDDEVKRRIANVQPEDLCTIIYTSGTTGDPKGVMLTQRNLLSNCEAGIQCFPVRHGDVTLSFLPLSHAFERMAGLWLMLLSGVTISYAENLNTIPQNLLEIRPTIITTVPRVLEKSYGRVLENVRSKPKWLQALFAKGTAHALDLYTTGKSKGMAYWFYDRLFFSKIRDRFGGRLKAVVSGGAALAPDIARLFQSIGLPVLEGYGLTETSPAATFNQLDHNKIGTVGRPIPGVEVKIAADGEILIRGPNIMKGYFKDPEATREAIDPEGWFHSGDIGEIDADGFLKITDRKKELIATSGGKKVAPQPMENELKLSPLISQAGIVGEGKNYLCALVVPNFETLSKKVDEKLSPEELVQKPEVRQMIQGEIDRFNSGRASYETIKKFELLPREWTIENGEITPTLKLRRKVISQNFATQIARMYA
jgi:long-chain acyl-CoA synthetase